MTMEEMNYETGDRSLNDTDIEIEEE